LHRICDKLEVQSEALKGKVFDVLGKDPFRGEPLRELLIRAIRYGDQPEVRARLTQKVDAAFDPTHIEAILHEHSLVTERMTAATVQAIRDQMARAETRKLQPHFIASFFIAALERLGGRVGRREGDRYEVTHVPAAIRNRGQLIAPRRPITAKYERVCFEKNQMDAEGQPRAELVCPGHPLLEGTIDLLLEQHRDLLRRGTVLVDSRDDGEELRQLFYMEHAVQDARPDPGGGRRVVSRELQFVEIGASGTARSAGYAPYLNYDAVVEADLDIVEEILKGATWLQENVESRAKSYAIAQVVPRHFRDVRERRCVLIDKTLAAVKERLTKEIAFWDRRANELKNQELAGKKTSLPSGQARQRADDLQGRLERRIEELEQERQISPMPPLIVGGALVVPAGLLRHYRKMVAPASPTSLPQQITPEMRKRIEDLAMRAVMQTEERMGRKPRDVSDENLGWDIESREPQTGELLFIEVKGRFHLADSVTLTRNELLAALNTPGRFILAIVLVDGDIAQTPIYQTEFNTELYEFAMTSVTFSLPKMIGRRASEGV